MPVTGADPSLDELVVQAPLTYNTASYELGVLVGPESYEVAAGDHTHAEYAEKANLATVATTGSYNDLTDQPNIPLQAAHVDPETGTVADVVNALMNAGLMARS